MLVGVEVGEVSETMNSMIAQYTNPLLLGSGRLRPEHGSQKWDDKPLDYIPSVII